MRIGFTPEQEQLRQELRTYFAALMTPERRAGLAGGSDYVMRLVVRTIEEYQGLIDGLLQASLGIQRYWTYVVTKPVKEFTGLPLETLLPQ